MGARDPPDLPDDIEIGGEERWKDAQQQRGQGAPGRMQPPLQSHNVEVPISDLVMLAKTLTKGARFGHTPRIIGKTLSRLKPF